MPAEVTAARRSFDAGALLIVRFVIGFAVVDWA